MLQTPHLNHIFSVFTTWLKRLGYFSGPMISTDNIMFLMVFYQNKKLHTVPALSYYIKCLVIIVVSVTLFGVLFFIYVKRSLKNQLDYYLSKNNKKKYKK